MREVLPSLLPDWLAKQRWFAGKGRELTGVTVQSDTVVTQRDEVRLHLVLVDVAYATGPGESYQLLLGVRRDPPPRLAYAGIGALPGEETVYDAVHDPELMTDVLHALAEERRMPGLTFARPRGTGAGTGTATQPLETDLPNRLNTTEQSNTSVIYGESYILKVFRRVAPGINPDLEITRALAEVGSTHVAAPLGWIEGAISDPTRGASAGGSAATATLGLLQPFFVSATEGWALATTSVRDLYAEGDLHADEVGGDFAAESERLGVATAEVHADLARALGVAPAAPDYLRGLAAAMAARLDAAVDAVPALEPFAEPVRAAFAAAEDLPEPLTLQRIHGDYHLGQVLRVDSGWILLDFEGEPAKPLAERRQPDSPLRDVAGMLRSFDYAARFLLADRQRNATLEFRATEWAQRNREAFCDGYAGAAGSDPRSCAPLLRAYELDKAVYEVVYEARHRPAWLPIPLNSIERLVKQR